MAQNTGTPLRAQRLVPCLADQTQNVLGRLGDICAGAKDCLYARVIQELIILLGYHTPTDHDDVLGICGLQRGDQFGRKRFVPRGLLTDANHVHIVIDGVLRRFIRCLEQGANVYIKPNVSKGRGDHFGAAIMTILANFDDKHPRPTAFIRGEILNRLLDRCKPRVALIGCTIHTCEGSDLSTVAAKHSLHCHANFTNAFASTGGINSGL